MLFRKPLNPGPSEVNTVKPGTDVAFECHALPSTSRSLPTRGCKRAIVHYDDDDSSSSDDDIYNYPEDVTATNLEDQPNLIESTENSIQNEEKAETDNDENGAEPYDCCGENSDEDSDPYGYRAEMLGQHFTSSDDDY